MPKITIYTTPYCPYCHRAKRLLAQKGAAFEEIDVSGDWEAREALAEKAGGLSTVPSAMTLTSWAWSRSFWSAYRLANRPITVANLAAFPM